MIKTIGTAYRRDDFTKEEFFDYWFNVHAPISRQAPGIKGYVVSEVVRKIAGEIETDAFVEQWFEDEQALAEATELHQHGIAGLTSGPESDRGRL